MEDIKNEVEAPRQAEKSFWADMWEGIILPALKNFWEKNSKEILATLKTLGESAVKAIINAIKNRKEEK
jgi:hypothetical protein